MPVITNLYLLEYVGDCRPKQITATSVKCENEQVYKRMRVFVLRNVDNIKKAISVRASEIAQVENELMLHDGTE